MQMMPKFTLTKKFKRKSCKYQHDKHIQGRNKKYHLPLSNFGKMENSVNYDGLHGHAVCDVKVFLGEHLRSESHKFDERI